MVKKTYVLDTNILLTDPNALYTFREQNIVLPLIVLEELDKHKTRMDEVGANARLVSKKLHEIITNSSNSLKSGVPIRNNITLKVVSSSKFLSKLPKEMDTSCADNHILAVCLGLPKKANVVLVSNDVLLRIKAKSQNITSEEYSKYNSTSFVEKSGLEDKIYSGTKTVVVSSSVLSEFWENKNDREFLAYAIEKNIGACYPNEFIKITDKSNGEPFIVRYMVHEARYVPDYFEIQKIKPRNNEQRMALDLLLDPNVKLVTCVGFAGTGKTLLSLAAGLEQVVDKKKYDSLLVYRPIQPLGSGIGFLPGTIEEKLEPWTAPIKDNLRFLLSTGNGRKSRKSESTLNYYFEHGIIEVEAMAYIRGRSITNAFMIIDEAQNLTMHELKTIVTRVGEGTKIVLTGDVEQIDNSHVDLISNGLSVAVEKFKEYDIVGHTTLLQGERSELASLAARVL